MDNAPELPESEDALYELATRSDADPYRREAAIKKLGELESDESSTQLEHLTEDGISAIERQLAETQLSALHSESAHDSSSAVDADEESSSLEERLKQDNERLRDTLQSTDESAEDTDST